MKKIILLLSAVLLWALPVSVSAQNKNNDKAKQQRKEQFDRFCKFRRDFMMKQIGLSEQEAKQFFPLYDGREKMDGRQGGSNLCSENSAFGNGCFRCRV